MEEEVDILCIITENKIIQVHSPLLIKLELKIPENSAFW